MRRVSSSVAHAADTCSSALAPFHALQGLPGLPAATLLAAGLASTGPVAGGPAGGPGAGPGGGGFGSSALQALASGPAATRATPPAPTQFDLARDLSAPVIDLVAAPAGFVGPAAPIVLGQTPAGSPRPDLAPLAKGPLVQPTNFNPPDMAPVKFGSPAPSTPTVDVPEPGGMAVIGFVAVAVAARMRRRPLTR